MTFPGAALPTLTCRTERVVWNMTDSGRTRLLAVFVCSSSNDPPRNVKFRSYS